MNNVKLDDLKKKIANMVKKFNKEDKVDILKSYNVKYYEGMKITDAKVVETIIVNLSEKEINELYKGW
jgi:uncharacterized protein (UPF0210 family)